jgi:FkbM family methyltransferase
MFSLEEVRRSISIASSIRRILLEGKGAHILSDRPFSASVGRAGRRVVKAAFRKMGVELRRYAPALSPLPNEHRRLSVVSPTNRLLPPRPVPFVLAATNHGNLIVNRNDYHAAEVTYGVGFQLLESSCFYPQEVVLALTLLSKRKASLGPGVIAVDCGANIGVHTIEWARHMHGWGNVIAIEAQERIFYSLCGNITINNCLNAKAIWAAVGSNSGKMRIPIPDYNKPASFGSLELRKQDTTEFIGQEINYAEDGCTTVDVMTIDDLRLTRLDLLKIDVEGMEMDVLLGAERTIDSCRPAMIIEVKKSNRGDITSFITNFGYNYYPFYDANILAIQKSDTLCSEISEIEGMLTLG